MSGHHNLNSNYYNTIIIKLIIFTPKTFILLRYFILIFTHLKLCLAAAKNNFKWEKTTHIYQLKPFKNVNKS